MNRVVSILLVLVVTAGIFSGCQKTPETPAPASEQNSTQNTESKTEAPKQNVTVSCMISQGWISEAEMALADKFAAETGIKMDFQVIPFDQYFNLLMTRLNSNDCTDSFGLMSSKFDYATQLNATVNAVDLSDMSFASRLDPLAKEHLSIDGKVYGYTLANIYTTWTMVYNKKIFEGLSIAVPNTFD